MSDDARAGGLVCAVCVALAVRAVLNALAQARVRRSARHFSAPPGADGHMRQRPRSESTDTATWGNE